MTTRARPIDKVRLIHDLRALVEFAYQQGFHEMGYGPIAETQQVFDAEPRAGDGDALAKAARYDWLKTNGIIRVFPMSSGMMSRGGSRILADTKDWLPGDFTYVIDGVTKDVDTAIDHAIAAQRNEGDGE